MVYWLKMLCKQGQATIRNWFNIVTYNICCFHIFEIFVNAREEMRQQL